MPLYDYCCVMCDNMIEVFHKMSEEPKYCCVECKNPMLKAMTTGAIKRPDAPWITDINGTINDLGEAQKGKQEFITTREQARKHIKHVYSDPHPRVKELKKRYLERY